MQVINAKTISHSSAAST